MKEPPTEGIVKYMSGLDDSTIYRIYRCTEQTCEAEIAVKELVKDPWQTKCPFCKCESLVLKSAKLNISCFIDSSIPKTIGSLAEKNRDKKLKEGDSTEGIRSTKVPFWRNGKKRIDYSILKNPKRYIEHGSV